MAKLTITPDTGPMGRRMTARMTELRLDDQDVAKVTGLSKDTIRAFRRLPDPHPTAKNAAAVAEVLGWTTDELLHGKGVDDSGNDDGGHDGGDDDTTLDEAIDHVKAIAAQGLKVSPGRLQVTITIV
jgi:hypothetical protein